MNTLNQTEIRNLLQANYERMAAFEMASFAAENHELKNYFELKAQESESNISQIAEYLPALGIPDMNVQNYANGHLFPASGLFNTSLVKKTEKFIVNSIMYIEKSILDWYKATLNSILHIPVELKQLLIKQYAGLKSSQLSLSNVA